ncbi:PHP domain-containing protein [candidate division WOR-3 bacterium]|nr:PHP domain-containing protein [candidate division WOR-3 bacterium]
MLKNFNADLHIHTCLSPCGDLTNSPKRVVEKALELNIDIIGICDHNSAENVQAAKNAGAKKKITVLAGMEITSVEEVHIIALFDKTQDILKLQDIIYEKLPPEENKEEFFGQQIIVNEFDEVEGYNKKLLIGATTLTLKEIVSEIQRFGGLAIAAHIDRESYSVIGQLGFIPEDLEFDALELSPNISQSVAINRFPGIEKFPMISSSDAHFLQDIGKATTSFLINEPKINEILMAFKKKAGRSFRIKE